MKIRKDKSHYGKSVITSTPKRQKPVKTSSKITGIFLLRHSLTSMR